MPINSRMDKMMTQSHDGKLELNENEQIVIHPTVMLHKRSQTQMNIYFMIPLTYC